MDTIAISLKHKFPSRVFFYYNALRTFSIYAQVHKALYVVVRSIKT